MEHKEHPKPNLWQILVSVLGALFGVQSSRVYQRDSLQGRYWWVYILVSVCVVALFTSMLILLAKFIAGA